MAASAVEGLRKLEYRGYDSAGLAVGPELRTFRAVGNVAKLSALVDDASSEKIESSDGKDGDKLVNYKANAVIAHTRWATHGQVVRENCHPVVSGDGAFAVVHNGVITNCIQLRATLEKADVERNRPGYSFYSETDTEVIAALLKLAYDVAIEECPEEVPPFASIVSRVIESVDGAMAIVVMSKHYPGEIVAFRRESPLHVAVVHEDAELQSANEQLPTRSVVISSDSGAIVDHAKYAITLEDMDLVHVGPTDGKCYSVVHMDHLDGENVVVNVTDMDGDDIPAGEDDAVDPDDTDGASRSSSGCVRRWRRMSSVAFSNVASCGSLKKVGRVLLRLSEDASSYHKGIYDHFMLKEIHEQPRSLMDTMRGRVNIKTGDIHLGGMSEHRDVLKKARSWMFIACGTSYNACRAAQLTFDALNNVPTVVELASSVMDREPAVCKDTVYVFVSQSGETADTLRACRYVMGKGGFAVGITNVVGSALSRETVCGIHLNAGRELGVASTKAYTSQIVALTMLAAYSMEDTPGHQEAWREITEALENLPVMVNKILALNDSICAVARLIVDATFVLMVGRGVHSATCLEGALKLMELSYIPTGGVIAGELKHGTLAIMEESLMTVVVATRNAYFDDTLSAFSQICARKGRPIVLCTEGDEENFRAKASAIVAVPKCSKWVDSIVAVIPLQLLAYHVANAMGRDVDQPRNLAKSVTVG